MAHSIISDEINTDIPACVQLMYTDVVFNVFIEKTACFEI